MTKAGRSKAVPPPRPVPVSLLMPSRYNDTLFWQGVRRSVGAHSILAILAVIGGVVFHREPVKFLPSIRVDLVALPDFKKSEQPQLAHEEAQQQAKPAKPSPPAPLPKEPPAEMALKKAKPNAKPKKGESLEDAINRIKALEKIENDVNSHKKGNNTAKPGLTVVKGNKVAKGDSLTGEAATGDTNAFISKMREKLQDNWNLPVWLSSKKYDARVLIFLDRSGFVSNLLVEKSSGDSQFDDYCIKTIRMAQPFGAPPPELVSTGITLGFPL